MLTSRSIPDSSQSAFCSFLKTQALLDHIPSHIYQQDRCASHYLRNNNLLETPVGMNEPRLRDGVTLPETAYYTVRLHGKDGKFPTPNDLRSLQNELAGIFRTAGVEQMPIACSDLWKAEEWQRRELARFDEVMPGGHGQDMRCEQQKYHRTQGDMVLSFPFPSSRVDDLCKAIAAVEEHRQRHCNLGK